MNPSRNDDVNNDQAALESIEHQLYDPKAKDSTSEVHHVKSHRSLDLPSSWGQEAPLIVKPQEDKGTSFGTKLLLFATVFFLIVLGFSAWRVMSSRNVVSSNNIDVTPTISPYVEGGELTPLTLDVRNRNTVPLEEVSVTLLYKQGSGSQDEQEKKQEKRDLGAISSNEIKTLDFSVSLYGSESEARDLTFKLEYKVSGSNALFTKFVTKQVILRTPPISVGIEGPDKLSVGQNGTFVFTVRNNSATTSLPSVLKLQLPANFTIESTTPKPITRSTSWNIAKLAKGESQAVTVVGSFEGKQGDTGTLLAKIGLPGDAPSEIGIVFASETRDVILRSSPLVISMSLFSDIGMSEVIKYGDRTRIEVTYINSSLEPLEDVSIVVKLDGDAALYNNIDPTSGYYDSVARTITWNKATLPDLAVLLPNGQGLLTINIPIVAKGTNSPTLKITASGSATSKVTDDVISSATKTYAVSGSATLVASTQFKTSSFANAGPIPPRPNQDTTYTVNLKVSAQNAIGNTKVSFTLPVYVSWRNTSSDSTVTYDSKTRTVNWNIGHMDQGKTLSTDIGLSVRPSQSHVGQSPVITSGIVLNADEEATRIHLKSTLSPLTTALKNEVWPENPSVVVDR